jgi:pimeloyl-ACP methyl ester carboxylesterase
MIDWTGQFIETPELAVHYVRQGVGPTVLFLHGWPEFARTWMHNLPALAPQFDCIAPDFRGFGETRTKTAHAGGSPPLLLARDLKDFADALGLGQFAIVSHDVGSFVAQTFAHAYPDRVSALFFFNCAYPGIGTRWGEAQNFPELWYQQFHQKDFAAALVGSSRAATRIYIQHFLTHWSHQKAAFEPHLDEWVDNFMRPGNLQGGFDWYVGVNRFRTRLMKDGAIAVPPIPHPTRVHWGRHDPVLQYAWTDRIGEYFSDCELSCAEDAGHFVHFERPADANAAISGFLGRVLA